jgi:hypothetical protein
LHSASGALVQQEVVHCLDVFAEEAHEHRPLKDEDFKKKADISLASRTTLISRLALRL